MVVFWHEAALASNAPWNDAEMLSLLKTYPNRLVADAASTALSCHLRYFSEHLVGLALFDRRVDPNVKRTNLQLAKTPLALWRVNATTVTDLCTCRLENFVTEQTMHLFELLSITGRKEAKIFLAKDPEEWEDDESYKKLRTRVHTMKVVNDSAEHGIALIQKYNDMITKDECQKQFLLQFVQRHRQLYPIPSKAAMTVDDH